jgi:hypothetical protein
LSKFKAGDRVLCIDRIGAETLTRGAVYTVKGMHNDKSLGMVVTLHEVANNAGGYYPSRFEKVPEPVQPGKGWAWIEGGSVAAATEKPTDDVVALPPHYRNHPSGVECITITQQMNFCRGNAIKYVWRAGEKGDKDKEIEDLRKARQYLDVEIKRLENTTNV